MGGAGVFGEGDKESAPGAFDCLDELLEFNLGGPETLGIGAYGVICVGGDALVLCLEGDLHAFERLVLVFSLVIVVP